MSICHAELCESDRGMAMLTQPLSCRRELVEGVDADPVLDYLQQHGVLDAAAVATLRDTDCVAQRNATLLQRLEGQGAPALALLINALRQSGQLHLASALDPTQRIQPPAQAGYMEKQRHKGEVTLVISVGALLLVVPERDTEGDVIDASMMASPSKRSSSDSPQRLRQSYENMLKLDEEPAKGGRCIAEYPYLTDDEEEDPGSSARSFFCFCFPLRAARKKKKAKETAQFDQLEMKQRQKCGPGSKDSGDRQAAERNGATSGRSSGGAPHGGQAYRLTGSTEPPQLSASGDSRRNSGSPKKDLNCSSKRDASGTPNREAGGTPKKDASGTPKKGASGTPKKDGSSTPKKGAGGTPKKGASGTHKKGAGGSPKKDSGGTPKKEGSGTPKRDMGGSVERREMQRGGSDRRKGNQGGGQNKENADPVIMEYNRELELVRLRAQREGGGEPRLQGSAVVLCQKWKCGGELFRRRRRALCEQFDGEVKASVVKYVEQGRGTLVLAAWTDLPLARMLLTTICMTRAHAAQLHADLAQGALAQRLDKLFRSTLSLQKLDICDLNLRVSVDEGQLSQALEELS